MSLSAYNLSEPLIRKFDRSVRIKERKIYFSDHTLRNFNGEVVGYWDSEWSLCENGYQSPEYIDAYDFKCKEDFDRALAAYLKIKGVRK